MTFGNSGLIKRGTTVYKFFLKLWKTFPYKRVALLVTGQRSGLTCHRSEIWPY